MGQAMALRQEQQVNLCQILGRDLVLGIEGVIAVMGQPEGLVEQGDDGQVRLFDRGGDEDRVQVMALQAAEEGLGEFLGQDQAQLRVLAFEGHQDQGHQIGAEGRDGADAQGAVQGILMGPGDPFDGVGLFL
jgi:hypothetical protein